MADGGKRAAKKMASGSQESHGKATKKARSNASSERASGIKASELIDQRIGSLNDWRGNTLAQVRRVILAADPQIQEEWKWMGTPVWSRAGNICTGETYKQVVKLTFARGASLKDPRKLFNSSLEGNTRRAIDIRADDVIDEKALKSLIQEAVALNIQVEAGKPTRIKAAPAKQSGDAIKSTVRPSKTPAKKVVLLTGGNPQVAKGDGDPPVQAYISAMPGWKQDLGKRIDALVVKTLPEVQKAVKWNSPFYGIEGRGWFMSFHVFTHYVKVTFFKGAELNPQPPGATERSKESRWIDIRENDLLDETLMSKWIQQAASLPGWLA